LLSPIAFAATAPSILTGSGSAQFLTLAALGILLFAALLCVCLCGVAGLYAVHYLRDPPVRGARASDSPMGKTPGSRDAYSA
jgi:hypothetical protein